MNLLFDSYRKAQISTSETDTVVKLHMVEGCVWTDIHSY